MPHPFLKRFAALFLGLGVAFTAIAQERVLQTEANVAVELGFTAARAHADPFNELMLDVVFTVPSGRELRVPAFWAGGRIWKARYASPELGLHTFRSVCSDTLDGGLNGSVGSVEIKPYTGKNPLYLHGPLRVAPGGRHLEHADHTPFFWLGDTWWMGLAHRLYWPDEFKQLAADRHDKGFNVIQIVAGLYPDMPPFDPRGANEAGFPWETNYARIRPEYFDAADQRLGYLVDQGFTPCIVGAWGYFMPWLGVEKMKAHWRYLIARYGAWPVVWCAAGEANLPWYRAPGFPFDDRNQVRDWTEVMRFIRATDPYHRPLTIHPTAINQYTSRHATDDPALLDFDLLQTPHGQREAVPVAINAVRGSYAAKPVMPVIDGEASYEMLSDRLPTEWTRRMFWICLMNGAAGHTYGANGIWQNNRPGDPHGASPTGGSYGKIPWSEAMNLPGSRQMGFGKKLLEEFPWQRFQPHPEWAAFADAGMMVSLEGASWIWFPEGNPALDAPAEKRFYRRVFALPAGKTVEHARLRATADDAFTGRLNGVEFGTGDDWHSPKQFNNLARFLRPGTNTLAILAENKPANVPANPAGLIARLEIRFTDGETLNLVSDAAWRCSRTGNANWDETEFDDSAWAPALAVGRYGAAPWGRVDPVDDEIYGPQATGISNEVRIIYVPEARPIRLRNLGANAFWTPKYFDPVTGAKIIFEAAETPLRDGTLYQPFPNAKIVIRADPDGNWTCRPPREIDHDWVVILQPAAVSPAGP